MNFTEGERGAGLHGDINRGKTPEQQIREGMAWEPIEKKKAEERGRLSLGRGVKGLKNFSDLLENGNVRDIIARRVGLGSGVTYEKGKEVVEYMDAALFAKDREATCMTLNEQSINAASKLVQNYKVIEEKTRLQEQAEEQERQDARN